MASIRALYAVSFFIFVSERMELGFAGRPVASSASRPQSAYRRRLRYLFLYFRLHSRYLKRLNPGFAWNTGWETSGYAGGRYIGV